MIWQQQGLYNTSSSSMDSSSTESVSSLPDRALAWVLARSKLDDKGNLVVPDEGVQKVNESIKEWKQKEKDGEFVPNRSDDSLARALGTKERSGRVRGHGGHKQYWGPNQREKANMAPLMSMDDLNALIKNHIGIALKAAGVQMPQEQMGDIGSPNNAHVMSSCQSGGVDPFADLSGEHNCSLALMLNGKRVTVAKGMVHATLRANHHTPLRSGHVKVSILAIISGHEDGLLPVSCHFVKKLGDAVGTFTQWPRNLVDLCDNDYDDEVMIPRQPSGKKAKVDSGKTTNESAIMPKTYFLQRKPCLTDKCRHLKSIVSFIDPNANIDIGKCSKEFCHTEETSIGLMRVDIEELLEGLWIGAPIMQVFMLALRDLHAEKFASKLFGFFCPSNTAGNLLKTETHRVLLYMKQAMNQLSGTKFILCPYHQKSHWGLLVISLGERYVYSFDSMDHSSDISAIKVLMDQAFQSYQMMKGKPKKEHKLCWSVEKCAQQQGGTECGYFTMRYMFELVHYHHSRTNLRKVFGNRSTSYYEDEIYEVEDILAGYLAMKIHH